MPKVTIPQPDINSVRFREEVARELRVSPNDVQMADHPVYRTKRQGRVERIRMDVDIIVNAFTVTDQKLKQAVDNVRTGNHPKSPRMWWMEYE